MAIILSSYNLFPTSSWSPLSLSSNLRLWLDSTNTTSIILNSSRVAEWRDISGNNRHVSQSNVINQPNYTSGKIVFDGVNHWMTFPTFTSAFDLIVVNKDNEVAGDVNRFSFISNPAGTEYIPIALSFDFANNNLRVNSVNYNSITMIINGTSIFMNTRVETYRELIKNTNKIAMVSVPIGNSLTSQIGGNPNYRISGDLNEIICTDPLSLINRQRLEGYLAHKWNLATSLPTNHPYKISPP